jgi:hypothetical protein
MQDLNDMSTAENVEVGTGNLETMFQKTLNAIGDSLSNFASSKDDQNGEDEENDEEDPELSMLSDDDEPGLVMGTISKTVQHPMENFRQW